MTRTRWLAALLAVLLIAGACTRDADEGAETGETGGEPAEETSGEAVDGEATDGDDTSLDEGGFGELAAVCQDGDASGSPDEGVTDDEIRIGVFSDKGATVAPGLNREMWDAAEAFASWCNEHGGILGRQIVLADYDVKLFEYEPRITEACAEVFALVGGGAVFDQDPNGVRVGCGLPNIAGYVVSIEARAADLQVQPVPQTVYSFPVGHYRRLAELYPDAVHRFGVMTGDLPATQLVRDQTVEAVEAVGYEVVYDREYTSQGETGWRNFVQELRDADVGILEFVGQPANLAQLNQAMDTEGWYPEVIVLQTNFYDETYAAEAGAVAGNTVLRSIFHPLELAEENKATQDYLDLLERYNPRGKVALLGIQGVSSWLLFAQAAKACGDELTRECLMEEAAAVSGWTGGGLHAPTEPGAEEAPTCHLMLSVDADGFHYEEELTDPEQGLFNCDPENIVTLQDDYGVPRP